jgi:cobalt-zinc-cadmium efflux system protein
VLDDAYNSLTATPQLQERREPSERYRRSQRCGCREQVLPINMHVHSSSDSHNHGSPVAGFLSVALAATLCLVVAEFAGGYLGHSIALTSDAFHNLSDIPTILISWFAARWSVRGADAQKTYGYRRAGILAAFANAILLALVALGLLAGAAERFRHPVPVEARWMIGLSLLALLINGGITLGLVRSRRDLNLRALLVHNFGDALSNIGILAGAFVIRSTGAQWLDPVLGAVIGALVLWSSVAILRQAGHILLEGLPRKMRLSDVATAILGVPGVQEVHDIHIWTLDEDLHALSCHVRIPDMHMEESEKILERIRASLEERFGIKHATIQFERAGLPDAGYYMPEPFRTKKA